MTGRAPLPTLRDQRKRDDKEFRLAVKDRAVQGHLEAAYTQLLQNHKDEAMRSLCVAVEAARGHSQMPEEMWRTLDAIVEALSG